MKDYTIDGFNDITDEEFKIYDTIINTIQNQMSIFGYSQVLTPTFESYDMYDIEGAYSRQKMFKLIDNEGKVLVLRPDATIPITRMVASNFKDASQVIKLAYITSIFRQSTSTIEFRKEFMQAGVEYFGNPSADCDGEIIALSINILLKLSIEKIHIDLGNVSFINSLFQEINLKDNERKNILSLIDCKNIGELNSYLSFIKMEDSISKIICEIPMLFGSFRDTLSKAKKLCINEDMKSALYKMEKTYEIVSHYGYEKYIYADLGFTNQFNYYSGLIFKGYINRIGEAVLSGGRYDSLSSTFGVSRSASGFGINISLLMDYVNPIDYTEKLFDCLISYDDSSVNNSIYISKSLRDLGISVNCINKNLYNPNISNYKYILYIKNNKLYYDDEIIAIDKFISIYKEDMECI